MTGSKKVAEIGLELNAVDNVSETTAKVEKRLMRYNNALNKARSVASASVDVMGHRFSDFSVALSNTIVILQDTVVKPLTSMISKFSQAGFQLEKMASRAHLSVDQLGALGFAAEQTGSSTNGVASAMQNLESKIYEASRGSLSAMQEIFFGCGKTFTEMQRLSPEERLMAVADAIQSVGSEAQKADIAKKMFGSDELLPLLKKGRDGIQALMAEGRDLGGPFSAENVAKSKQLAQALNRIKTLFEGIKTSFLTAMADTITDLLTRLKELMKRVQTFMSENPQFVKKIGLITASVVGLVSAGGLLFPIFMGVNTIISSLLTVMSAFLSPWILLPTLILGVSAAFGQFNTVLNGVIGFVRQTLTTIFNGLHWFFGDAIAFIMQGNFAEAWKSLWLRVLILYYEFKDKISEELRLFSEIWEVVTSSYKPITEFFANLWNWIVSVFESGVEKACSFLSPFFKYINDTLSKIWESCTSWFSSILESVGASSSSIAEVFLAGWYAAQQCVLQILYGIKDAFTIMITYLEKKWVSWQKSIQHGVNYITGKIYGLSDEDIQKMNTETDEAYDKKSDDIQRERNEALLQSEAERNLAIENTRSDIADRIKTGREKQEQSRNENRKKIEEAQLEIIKQKQLLPPSWGISGIHSEDPNDPNYQSGGKLDFSKLREASQGTQNSFQAMFGFGQTTVQKQLEVSQQILQLFELLIGNAGM